MLDRRSGRERELRSTFGKIEAHCNSFLNSGPRSAPKVEQTFYLRQRRRLAVHFDLGRRRYGSGQANGEPGTGKRRLKRDTLWSRVPGGQFPSGPVSGDVAELHPDQVVERRMKATDPFLKDTE